MILLKQADVYAPEHLGIKDVLVCGGKIEAVGDNLEGGTGCEVIDAKRNALNTRSDRPSCSCNRRRRRRKLPYKNSLKLSFLLF